MIRALVDERLRVVCVWVCAACCRPPGLLALAMGSRGGWLAIATYAPPGTPVEELEIVPAEEPS